MSIQIDETVQVFIDEAMEHLADIETDLLSIEQAGADIDEEVVNKVYRAAHSIKGAAGFFGLNSIKMLTHEMENVLGRIRSRELIPNPENINLLLSAADMLNTLIADVTSSNEVDVSDYIAALAAIEPEALSLSVQPAAGSPTGGLQSPSDAGETDEPDKGSMEAARAAYQEETTALALDDDVVLDLLGQGKYLYLVKMDLIRDLQAEERDLLTFLEDLSGTGTIAGRHIDTAAIGPLEAPDIPANLPFIFVFSTILPPEDVNMLLEVDESQIFQITSDLGLYPIGSENNREACPEKHPLQSVASPETNSMQEPPQNALHPPAAIHVPDINPEKAMDPAPPPATPKTPKVPKQASASHETSLRIQVSLLDSLMNLAGELVLGRNQLLQALSTADQRQCALAGQRIDLVTSEIQEAIMLTRMQPIGIVFNKFPRVVRDLSRKLDKEIDLKIEGNTVELDKTIIEAINDPLTHLVRNAVDHGIEAPEVRLEAGKPKTGRVTLKAYHAAGQVNIEISDDGRGLDGDKLAAAAQAKGLVSDDQIRNMSAREKVNLIFWPGFSTAEKISDVSGRGVGMDVVKTNLDKLGGHTDIDSTVGAGTTIRIKLPLTLAIIPSQIVISGRERYAVPQVNLVELLRVPADQVKNRIEKVAGAEVLRLRGNLLPLVRLADVLGVQRTYNDPQKGERSDRRMSIADQRSHTSPSLAGEQLTNRQGESVSPPETVECTEMESQAARTAKDRRYRASSALNIAVVSAGAMKYGLIVDRLLDSEEIVVKPLGRDLTRCRGYAGATIMGDGRVALILDVGNLAIMAGLTSVEESERATEVAMEMTGSGTGEKQSLLLFRCAPEEHFAIPLNQVQRIEKIRAGEIETLGDRRVIQYRGGSLPLFAVDEVAQVKPIPEQTDLMVLVFTLSQREIGLLATGPVDAVQVSAEVDTETLRQPGILGSNIIKGKTFLWVDIFELVQTIKPEWFEESQTRPTTDGKAATVLYAEDSTFFRTQVMKYLEEAGYTVMAAEDGAIAWQMLEKHAAEITVVVTDIEMPNLNGFELAQKIKSDPRFAHLPVIALTTLADTTDVARGQAAGIDDYQVKLDRETLLNSLEKFIHAK